MTRNYEKMYINRDSLQIAENETCQACARNNIKSHMKFMYLNSTEAIYKCSGANCMYPFRNFIFKDLNTNRMYRYQFEQNSCVVSPSETAVGSFENNPAIVSEATTPKSPGSKIELRKCLKSIEKKIPKKSKFCDVNQLLDIYNKSAKKTSADSGKINVISVVNPLNLIQCLNRTTVKLIPNDNTTSK